MNRPPSFFARLKAQLTGQPIPEPIVQVAPADVPTLHRHVKVPDYTAGPGVDWDLYERTRVLRLCACGQRHRRCDECAQFVCAAKPHHCPAGEAGAAEVSP